MIKRKFFWVSAVALVIVILLLNGYNNRNIKIIPLYQTSSMHQINLEHKDGNTVKWNLKSDMATFPTGKKKIFLDSVNIKINLSPEINLSGKNGVYEIEDKSVTLSKNVVLAIEDTLFETDTLRLSSIDETITTEDAIKYSGRNFLIEGTGLFAKMEQQEVKILNDVKATFYH